MKEKKSNIVYICKECSEQKHKDWQDENKGKVIEKGNYVKVAVTDGNKIEHLWFEVISKTGSKFLGKCNNVPIEVKNIRFGDKINFQFKDIEEFWG